jgi:hypothetical protein
MAKFVLIILFFTFTARADLFDFGSDKSDESKIPSLIEKLKSLVIKDGPEFEELFNLSVKNIENAIEQEKLFCSGEAVNKEGKVLSASKKPLCMRELKKQYLQATAVIFEMKKKYLGFIHQRQLKKLDDISTKLKADIEKNF